MTSGPSPLWYATRATGATALVLLTATVALGVAGTARFATPRWPRVITAGLHRNLSLLAVGFVAVHVATTVLDPFAPIGWLAAVVPFTSAYRPLWLSLGTIASDMLAAVVLTSLVRVRLGYRSWRTVHWLGYACWPVALWHGLGTGTDSKLPWLLGLDAGCVAAVAAAAWWRLSLAGDGPRRQAGLALTGTAVLATIAFVAAGPLRPGWARRAGTPVALLGGSAPSAAGTGGSGGASGHSAGAAALPSEGSFSGHAARSLSAGGSRVTITVTARTGGSAGQQLVITLHGAPEGDGVALSAGSVRIRPAGAASSFSGPVVELNGQQVVADLSGAGGYRAKARITLAVQGRTATGRLSLVRGGTE